MFREFVHANQNIGSKYTCNREALRRAGIRSDGSGRKRCAVAAVARETGIIGRAECHSLREVLRLGPVLFGVELTEGVRIGNYRSVTVRAAALAEPALEVDAFALTSDRRDPTLTPSERYMACLVAGAEEHGLPPEYVAFLRGVPARPETPEAAALRPLFENVLRRRS